MKNVLKKNIFQELLSFQSLKAYKYIFGEMGGNS